MTIVSAPPKGLNIVRLLLRPCVIYSQLRVLFELIVCFWSGFEVCHRMYWSVYARGLFLLPASSDAHVGLCGLFGPTEGRWRP